MDDDRILKLEAEIRNLRTQMTVFQMQSAGLAEVIRNLLTGTTVHVDTIEAFLNKNFAGPHPFRDEGYRRGDINAFLASIGLMIPTTKSD